MRTWCGIGSVLLVSGFFVGCGDDPVNPAPEGGAGETSGGTSGKTSGGTSGISSCGYTCTCENGLIGKVDCETNACTCAECPNFAPPEPVPFEACGGDPTGFWRLSDYDQGAFELSLTSVLGQLVMCRGQFPEPVRPTHFLLELKANGEASLQAEIDSHQFEIAKSCLSGAQADCNSLVDYDCEETDCGLCECTNPGSAETIEQLTWSAKEGELSLVGEDFSVTLPFCVDNGKLSYRAKGASNLVSLERIYRTGEPQLCADRRPEDCTTGDHDTCALGQCVGTGSCSEAADAATCAKFQGCAWDASSCHGLVFVHCMLTDYINGTPGCALSESPPTCKGTPWSCEQQPGCEAKGCLFGAACTGGQQPCEYDDHGIEGCSCDLSCTGTLNCSSVKTAAACTDAGQDRGLTEACEWSTTACVATAAPCEKLTLDECETTIGCVLQTE
jgi:hypothetical protein